MLEMNIKPNINNLNYLRYMEYVESDNGAENQNLERERSTLKEESGYKK